MARYSRPWRRADRGSWYAHVHGKKVRLTGPSGTQKEAEKELARLLSGQAGEPQVDPSRLLVSHVLSEWLTYQAGRVQAGDLSPVTLRSYADRLACLSDEINDLAAQSLRPEIVRQWIARQGQWGPTSRHDRVATIKLAFRWALREGLISTNPLDPLRLPRRKISREVIPTREDLGKFSEEIKYPELRELFDFILATGCRPGEAARLEARHYRQSRGLFVIEGKTTHRTGVKRQVILPEEWIPKIERMIEQRPEGPLFLNSKGHEWNRSSIGLAFRRARGRAGLGSEVSAYALRHRRITDLLEQGTPLSVVAAIAGHSSSGITSRIYSHVDQAVDLMRAELSR